MTKKLRFNGWFMASVLAIFLLAAGTVSADWATPTIDGTKDVDYGTTISSQTVQTNFGDADGSFSGGGGGELDALYLANDDTNLYIMLTGNVEIPSDNGVFILFDNTADATGETTLTSIPASKDGLFGNDSLGTSEMPAGFNADVGLMWKNFGSPMSYVFVVADFSTNSEAASADTATGATDSPAISLNQMLDGNTYSFGFDNSNAAGVSGGTIAGDPVAADAVNTGLEIAIPLNVLGLTAPPRRSPPADLHVMAFYTSGSFGSDLFISNQFLPPLPTPMDNVGGPADPADSNPLIPNYDFGINGLNLNYATYTLAGPPADAQNWNMYE